MIVVIRKKKLEEIKNKLELLENKLNNIIEITDNLVGDELDEKELEEQQREQLQQQEAIIHNILSSFLVNNKEQLQNFLSETIMGVAANADPQVAKQKAIMNTIPKNEDGQIDVASALFGLAMQKIFPENGPQQQQQTPTIRRSSGF